MTGKGNAVHHPLRAEARWRQNVGARELWNADFPWNWVFLGSILGCLLFWALVVWGSLSVF